MHIFQTIAASLLTILLSWFFPHQVPSVKVNPSVIPTNTPMVSFSPTQTDSSSANSQDFIYPGAEKIQYLGNVTTFVSTDDPQQITAWYEDKIKSLQLHNTAVSKTNSNNNILNFMQASNDQEKIKIEITRAQGDADTSVTITK